MSCSNQVTNTQYDKIIKTISSSIIEIKLLINTYKKIHTCSNNQKQKNIIKSIIIDKNSHLSILKEIYKVASGENDNLETSNCNLEKKDTNLMINICIEKEFEFINMLKTLRSSIPNQNLKHAINIVLIDQNNIVNKLLYTICKKK